MTISNNPPLDADYYATQAAAFAQEAADWNIEAVTGEDKAKELADYIDRGRKLASEAEKARKALKEPYLEAGRKVDADFKPVAKALQEAVEGLKLIMTQHLRAEEQKRLAAEAEARRKAEEARKAAEEAQKEDPDSLGAEVSADVAKDAELAAAQARAEAQKQRVKGSDGGRAMSLRTVYDVEVIDSAALVAHYASDPVVIAAATDAAKRDVRSAKGNIEIPGVRVRADQKAA